MKLRVLIWTLIFTLLLSFTLTFASAEDSLYFVKGGWLNVRAETSIKSERLGRMYTGTRVYVNYFTDGWANITFKGENAYVMAEFLTKDNPKKPQVTAPSFGGELYRITRDKVNIRKGPSKEKNVVQRLNTGDVIEVLSIGNVWAEIKYRGYRDGYVMIDFIEKK